METSRLDQSLLDLYRKSEDMIWLEGCFNGEKSSEMREAKALLAAGADPNVKGELGKSPLHYAARERTGRAVKILVEAGAELDVLDEDGYSPLHIAVGEYGSSLEPICILIDAGADVDVRGSRGRTPLIEAAGAFEDGSFVAAMDVLLEAGADPNIADDSGNAPLHFASTCADAAAVRLLLDAGADPNAKNVYGCTPLHDVACTDCEYSSEVAEDLLRAGGDPSARDPRGRLPEECAESLEMFELLRAAREAAELSREISPEAPGEAGRRRGP